MRQKPILATIFCLALTVIGLSEASARVGVPHPTSRGCRPGECMSAREHHESRECHRIVQAMRRARLKMDREAFVAADQESQKLRCDRFDDLPGFPDEARCAALEGELAAARKGADREHFRRLVAEARRTECGIGTRP